MTLADAIVRVMNDPMNKWEGEGDRRIRYLTVSADRAAVRQLLTVASRVSSRRLGDAPAGALLICGFEWDSTGAARVTVAEIERPWNALGRDADGVFVDANGQPPYPPADFDAIPLE